MAIINTSTAVRKWYYETKRILFVDNISNAVLFEIGPERMSSLIIGEDFEKMYFPLLTLTLMLTNDEYYKVLEIKDSISIFLRIDKFSRDDNESEKNLTRSFINQTFITIIEDNNIDINKKIKLHHDIDDYTTTYYKSNGDDPSDVSTPVKFYLFPDTVNKTKKLVNKILSNVTVTEAITWLLYNANINNVLMGRVSNGKLYNELVIPPLSTLKALSFIDTYYGLYRPGSMIFFGLFYNYILPYSGKVNALPKDGDGKSEVNIIVPLELHNSGTGMVVDISNEKIDYVVCDRNTISITDKATSNDYINTNNIESIDSYHDIIKHYQSNARKRHDSGFTRFFENRTENDMLPETYIAQTSALSSIISMTLENIDIEVFKPYKRFNILFEDNTYAREHTGNYILSSITHNLISNGAEMSVVTSVNIKKDTLNI